MTSYVTPRKNVAFKFYISLVDQSNTKLTKANPTIASGDFKVSTDGGAFANLSTLPSANPASGRAVMIDLSSGEMNGDNIVVQCVDAAGAEWCDLVLNIQTTARQIDDLAFPLTTGRGTDTDASGRLLLQPTQPSFTTTSWGGFTSSQLFDKASYTAPLSAATTRSALGMASASYDTDIATVNTKLDTIDDFVDTEVAAIKAKTDNLPAAFPANFAASVISASGIVSADTKKINGTTILGDGDASPFHV